MLQQIAVQAGQAITRAKIDVAALKTSPAKGQLSLSAVEVADPEKPDQNLFQFDRAWLELDPQALLQRRLVASRSGVSGLRFSTDRQRSGRLPSTPESKARGASERFARDAVKVQCQAAFEAWLADLATRLEGNLAREFAAVRLAQTLSARWPNEYAQMEARVARLQDHANRVRDLANRAHDHPLRHLDAARKGISEADAIRLEVLQIRGELERLYGQMLLDRDSIREAAQIDKAKISESLALRRIDPQHLADFLLGEQFTQRLTNVTTWLSRTRQLAEYVTNDPQINHQQGRGTDVHFASAGRRPDVLVRTLSLSGFADWEGRPLEFAGTIEDLTTQPQRHDRPARMRVATRGDTQLAIDAIRDRRQDQASYEFHIEGISAEETERVLGDAKRLAIHVSPGEARIVAKFTLAGDDLRGELRWEQLRVQLTPQVSKRLGGEKLEEKLATSLGAVRQLQVSAEIQGTLDNPQFDLDSELGAHLANTVNEAVQRELQELADVAARELDALLDKELADLEQAIDSGREKLESQLAIGEDLLAEFKQELNQQLNLPSGLLNVPLRVGSLFDQ
jgi:uncharacterized protein (TIGR03545 family)